MYIVGRLGSSTNLRGLTRPDGTTVTSVYDPRGRLRERFAGADWRHLDYDDATHELTSIGASSGVAIGYAYDGPVVRELAVTGPVSGRIVYTHDADGFVDSRTVAGRLTRYTYDRDKLLTGAGPVTLTYDPRLGLPTGHSVGTIATSLDARSDGDVFAMTTSVAGARLHRVEVIRDTAGRLLEERETLLGVSSHPRPPKSDHHAGTARGPDLRLGADDQLAVREERRVREPSGLAAYGPSHHRRQEAWDLRLTPRPRRPVRDRGARSQRRFTPHPLPLAPLPEALLSLFPV